MALYGFISYTICMPLSFRFLAMVISVISWASLVSNFTDRWLLIAQTVQPGQNIPTRESHAIQDGVRNVRSLILLL